MEIEGITLWLFGGVAKFKGMFPSAGAEFRIAIAGPLVSLVARPRSSSRVALAVRLPEAVDGVAAWLGYINLALLVFNLLPALPLDGGRVLRSALWQARGDFAWATRIAAGDRARRSATSSSAAASPCSSSWTPSAAPGSRSSAGSCSRRPRAEDRYLAHPRRRSAGSASATSWCATRSRRRPQLTLAQFMDDVVWQRRYTTYPVTEDGRAVGLLPVPLRRRGAAERVGRSGSVRDCMLPREQVPVVNEDDELVDAAAELSEHDVRRALVLDGDRLVGLLSITDVARALEMRGALRRRQARS